MAVTNYRLTYFFEGIEAANRYSSSVVGWTESWYYAVDGNLDAALNNLAVETYIRLRRAFMPSIYRMVWVRANDASNPRASKTRAIINGFGNYSGPPALVEGIIGTQSVPPQSPVVQAPTQFPTLKPAQVTCAVLVDFVRMPTAAPPILENAHHKRFLLRGLPSDLIVGNLINDGARSFNGMRIFLDFVGNHETGSGQGTVPNHLLRFITPTNPKDYEIVNLVPQTDPRLITVTSAGGSPAVVRGQQMQISGLQLPDRVNRVWTVISAGAANGPYSLGRSKKAIAAVAISGQGRIRLQAFSFQPADQYLIIGMRTKHTGKPFRLTRGKRRVL